MPRAVQSQVEYNNQSKRSPKSKTSSSRELQQLHNLYINIRSRYSESSLSLSINHLLESKTRPAVTRIISLGLGTLKSTDQSRRIKQLVILIAIAEQLHQYTPEIEIYAQDPSFSKIDETFLESFGVQILRTPSATDLGEAAQFIDESTLVYCPFLTLEAYQLLFTTESVNFFIGDDFDALRVKWPKHSSGRNEAELLFRRSVQGFRKRVISRDDEFWDAEDKPFPMALYSNGLLRRGGKQLQAKL